MKEDTELKGLIYLKKKEAAIIHVKEKYNVSLKEADEYVSSLIFRQETAVAKKNTRKKRKITIISLLVGAAVLWFSLEIRQALKQADEADNAMKLMNAESFGPSTYERASLNIANDSTMTVDQKVALYIKLNKLRLQGVPYKETFYWIEYLEKIGYKKEK
ncbi:MAG: hypothetical protein H6Q14_773 [Bacteroidetes bacterium]|nr:hypothetical protein [Bacteroidota bacterium]